MTKYNIEFCRKLAAERGGLCLSLDYKNCDTKYLWKCANQNHPIWKASLSTILTKPNGKSGGWCRLCFSENRKLTIDYCREIAIQRDGLFLSETYIDANTKYKWKCREGHTWEAAFNSVLRSSWCPKCCKNYKYSIEDCHTYAQQKNGKCLSETYINSKEKILWECEFGHQWLATFNNLLSKNQWCPECYGNKRLDINYCKKIASNNNWECLSSTYKNNRTILEWKCNKCKIIKSCCLSDFKQTNFRCSNCSPTSLPQKDIENFIKSLGFNCNYNDRKQIYPYELDIYIPEKKIAIEFCGLYWHSEEQGKDKYYHYNKFKLCKDKKIRLITIFEDEWCKRKEQIKNYLMRILDLNNKISIKDCEITELDEFIGNNFSKDFGINPPKNVRYVGIYLKEELIAVYYVKTNKNSLNIIGFDIKYDYDIIDKIELFNCLKAQYKISKITLFSNNKWEGNYNESKLKKHIEPKYYSTLNNIKIWDCGHTKWEI